MKRRGSSTIRPDGRIRLRVDLPVGIVAAAERMAEVIPLDREAVLGDLAAAALPDELADAARARLVRTPPGGTPEALQTHPLPDETGKPSLPRPGHPGRQAGHASAAQ
jgi:hypothetical protein